MEGITSYVAQNFYGTVAQEREIKVREISDTAGP